MNDYDVDIPGDTYFVYSESSSSASPGSITDNIEAYCIDEKNHNFGASISFGNGYYKISGYFEDENVFLEILNGVYFKSV